MCARVNLKQKSREIQNKATTGEQIKWGTNWVVYKSETWGVIISKVEHCYPWKRAECADGLIFSVSYLHDYSWDVWLVSKQSRWYFAHIGRIWLICSNWVVQALCLLRKLGCAEKIVLYSSSKLFYFNHGHKVLSKGSPPSSFAYLTDAKQIGWDACSSCQTWRNPLVWEELGLQPPLWEGVPQLTAEDWWSWLEQMSWRFPHSSFFLPFLSFPCMCVFSVLGIETFFNHAPLYLLRQELLLSPVLSSSR